MLKKHPLLLSSLLLSASLHLNAQQEDMNVSSLITKETAQTIIQNMPNQASETILPFTGAITGSKVRMRTNPSLEGHVVRETTNGEMFVVVSEVNDYYAVLPPKETKGYVFRTFILDGAVEGERVNVRLYPDIDAPVIGQLNTGDKVAPIVSEANNKWFEISLPENSRFFIAKEYIENKGSADLFATIEKKRTEALHHLSAASLFAQAEIQKPFEQIDLDRINDKFEKISAEYQEIPTIAEQVRDAHSLLQDIYVQKKVAFLENKTHYKPTISEIESYQLDKLTKLSSEVKSSVDQKNVTDIAFAASKTIGFASTLGDEEITDKMLVWQPLEESLYHLWAAINGEKSMEDFYAEEERAAMVLTGIVEPYNRPVKNRPGDFLLRNDSMPVAFLYSTRINLEKLVGQKISVLATPRPNHNFAFPAYFVISVE